MYIRHTYTLTQRMALTYKCRCQKVSRLHSLSCAITIYPSIHPTNERTKRASDWLSEHLNSENNCTTVFSHLSCSIQTVFFHSISFCSIPAGLHRITVIVVRDMYGCVYVSEFYVESFIVYVDCHSSTISALLKASLFKRMWRAQKMFRWKNENGNHQQAAAQLEVVFCENETKATLSAYGKHWQNNEKFKQNVSTHRANQNKQRKKSHKNKWMNSGQTNKREAAERRRKNMKIPTAFCSNIHPMCGCCAWESEIGKAFCIRPVKIFNANETKATSPFVVVVVVAVVSFSSGCVSVC